VLYPLTKILLLISGHPVYCYARE